MTWKEKIKHTYLRKIQKIAETNGGKCLSFEYVSQSYHLTFECKNNHIWNAAPRNITAGHWCAKCRNRENQKHRLIGIEEMQSLASLKRGKCLSTTYINSASKLTWQCIQGHIFNATPNGIQQGRWCPYCSGHMGITIKTIQQLAETHGGKCLSKEYLGCDVKLLFQCGNDHTWLTTPELIKQGQWCPSCNLNTLDEIKEIAIKKGGKCLSNNISPGKISLTHLLFRCGQGHEWTTKSMNVKVGHWCPFCAREQKNKKRREHTIRRILKICEEHQGSCNISPEITSSPFKKIQFQCKKGHLWETIPYNVIQGFWCPKCRESKMELKCRKVIECILGIKMPTSHPHWLKNNSSNNSNKSHMHLDGYNSEYNIAFEYQGRQHYSFIHYFHKNTDEFQKLQSRDKLKEDLCAQHDVKLIKIPYTIKTEHLEQYILSQLQKLNIQIKTLKPIF